MNPDINITGKQVRLVRKTYDYPKGTKGIATYDPKYSHGINVTLPDNTECENNGKPYDWFFTWEEIELVQEMNKYNIEVGDEVSPSTSRNSKVYHVTDEGVDFLNNNTVLEWSVVNSKLDIGDWKLVKASKMNKKIIGYKLLKEIIEYPAGTLFTFREDTPSKFAGYYAPNYSDYYCTQKDVENTKWFEPIYETKPTVVFVDTLAGKVRVDKIGMSLGLGQYVPMPEVKKIINAVAGFHNAMMVVHSFDTTIDTFKVGCKTFSVNDIKPLQDAIKQVTE